MLARHFVARGAASSAPPLGTDPFAGHKSGLVLYGPPTSRVTKVMWAAAEVGQSWESVASMWPERRSGWYLALNPKGTVPTLRDGALVINESNSAVAYLLQKYQGGAAETGGQGQLLYPSDPAELALAWQWAEWGETTLAPSQNPVFFPLVRKSYAPAAKKAGCPGPDEIEASVPRLAEAWRTLDNHLAAGGPYILGARFSLADFTAAVQANRLVRHNGFGFAALEPSVVFPAVLKWYNTVASRPAFAQHVLDRFK